MFDFIRSHQRLMQFVLLVLIVPSFALIGVSGYNTYVSGDHDLVKVGDTAVTLQEFERARANQLRQMQESSPGGFDPAVLDNPAVRSALLESLVDYRLVTSTAAAERFSVSDAVLRQSIASMPQLQEDGRFSAERYNEVLASVGLTTRDFEQGQRFELAISRVLGPVSRTASIPQPVIDQLGNALTESRTIRMHAYGADQYYDRVSVDDSDVQAWYNENKEQFEVPEQASIQYLLLDEDAAMANLPELTDADLQSYYEQNKARFTRKGRVNISHIQLNVPSDASQEQREQILQQAHELATRAQADPSTFAELATEHSQDAGSARNGGSLGWVTQGTWPPMLDRAIFQLTEGQVSDVVEGMGSYHIFYASQVEPEQVQTLEEVRDDLTQEVRHQMGADRFADMATRLTSLVYDHPDSLEPAAQALSMSLGSASGITRDGLLNPEDAGEHAAALSPHAAILNDIRVRRAVFSPQVLNDRHNSGVIEISPDTMIAVSVVDVIPAHIPPLEQVAERIRDLLIAERAHVQAVQEGQQALSELAAAGSLTPSNTSDTNGGDSQVQENSDTGAGSDGVAGAASDDALDAESGDGDPRIALADRFGDPVTISRIDTQGLEKSILDAALAMSPDELPAYTGVETARGYVIVRVEDAGTQEADSPLLSVLPDQLAQMWGQAEEEAVLQAMRAQVGVEYLPEATEAINTPDSNN